MKKAISSMALGIISTLLLAMCVVPTAHAVPTAPSSDYTGWVEDGGTPYWFDNGVMARSKEIYDLGSDAWYWIDADGTMARDKDVYLRSNGGKWVRYDSNGHMVKGEDYRYGGWYYFNTTTGAMAKGMTYLRASGDKWVYYDWTTGQMAHGEKYVNYDAEHTGWYLFDQYTGAMAHGDVFVRSNGGKWVRYDRITGKMIKGLHYQDNAWYYFDKTTGAMAHGRAWVPDWNKYAYFDSVTGRFTGRTEAKAPSGGAHSSTSKPSSPSGSSASTSGVRRGRFCKKTQIGQRTVDVDGVRVVCECRNGNNTPHWYQY